MNPRYALWLSTKPETVKLYAFSAWIMAHWRQWEKEVGHAEWRPKSDADHAAFDAWLNEHVAA